MPLTVTDRPMSPAEALVADGTNANLVLQTILEQYARAYLALSGEIIDGPKLIEVPTDSPINTQLACVNVNRTSLNEFAHTITTSFSNFVGSDAERT